MKLTSDRRNFFLGFLALVSLAFLAILVPFYSALMWAVILAMLFAPMQRALMRRMPQCPNTATFITLGAAAESWPAVCTTTLTPPDPHPLRT